jgi:toxin secretion/phage lysis holin
MSGFFAKCMGALGVLLLQFSFGSIGFQIVIAVIMLIVIDTITGLMGAKKVGEPIHSKRFFDSIIKLIFFPMIIASASITQTALGTDMLFLPQIVAGYLAMHEFLSIIENFGKIGYVIPQKILNRNNLTNFIADKAKK